MLAPPEPLVADVIIIHESLGSAVQAQLESALILNVPVPPVELKAWLEGVSEYVHPPPPPDPKLCTNTARLGTPQPVTASNPVPAENPATAGLQAVASTLLLPEVMSWNTAGPPFLY